jgi:hypothetical protein
VVRRGAPWTRRRGAKLSLEELRAKVPPGPEGLSLQQLRQVAAERGLPCQCVRCRPIGWGRCACRRWRT